MVPAKRCPRCGEIKSLDQFGPSRHEQDQKQVYCIPCHRAYAKINYERKKDLDMRDHKFKAIFKGLTGIAKKVYDAVPVSEAWTIHQIMDELRRLHPTVKEHRVVLGCIQQLTHSGIIDVIGNDTYQRVPIVYPTKSESAESPKTEAPTIIVPPEVIMSTPIDKISQLQQQVAKISEDIKALSSAIDTVAIEVELQFSERDAESQKLKQLQTLLKGLV